MAERRKRRKWSDQEKVRIIAQTRVPGVSVPEVAHRYDVNANLIFKWIRDPRYTSSVDNEPEALNFLPVEVTQNSLPAEPAQEPLPVDYPNDSSAVTNEDLDVCRRNRHAERFCRFIVPGRTGSGTGPVLRSFAYLSRTPGRSDQGDLV